jgi:hypothetical protein
MNVSHVVKLAFCSSRAQILYVYAFGLMIMQVSDAELTRVAARLSEGVFEKVWDNPDDAEYDNL